MVTIRDTKALREFVESLMNNVYPDKPQIISLRTEPHDYSSTFSSHIVSLKLSGDREFELFLKDYSQASRPVQQLKQRRSRERLVYKEILDDAELGTARYLGSLWDDEHERYWLALEYVDGKLLKLSGLEEWFDAVRWLVGLHSYSGRNGERLRKCGFLVTHDESLFLGTAEGAADSISKYSAALVRRLDSALREYDELTREMIPDQPVLVHGSYNRLHILFDQSVSKTRVCPVDWESAALGSNLYDLAFLLDGYEGSQLDEFITVYVDETRKHGMTVVAPAATRRIMNGHCIHRTLKWLSWAWDERFPEAKVVDLIRRVERLSNAAF